LRIHNLFIALNIHHACSKLRIIFWQNSRLELGEENDGEEGHEEDNKEDYVQRRFVANKKGLQLTKMKVL
jgi:hypothetical protein